jgi:hypothetical protein
MGADESSCATTRRPFASTRVVLGIRMVDEMMVLKPLPFLMMRVFVDVVPTGGTRPI